MDTAISRVPAPVSRTFDLTVEGPFSLRLLLRNVLRRPSEIVDLAVDGAYHRLLVHRGRRLLVRAAEPGSCVGSSLAGGAASPDATGAGGTPALPGEDPGERANPRALTVHVDGVDGPPDQADVAFATTALRRILGLDASPQPFYDHVRGDPVLGPLTSTLHGLRPLGSPAIFEMLVVAILGQQISLAAAGAIKSRMVRSLGAAAQLYGRTYHAFPSPESLSEAGQEQLIGLAFSRGKAAYVQALARQVADGALDLEALRGRPHAEILQRLIALHGVGRWTAEYVLLRGYGYPDALPAGDAGLRRQLWRLYSLPAPPSEAEITAMAARWAPYRSWATLYLWNAGLLEESGPLRGQ